jgi:phage-related holin
VVLVVVDLMGDQVELEIAHQLRHHKEILVALVQDLNIMVVEEVEHLLPVLLEHQLHLVLEEMELHLLSLEHQ